MSYVKVTFSFGCLDTRTMVFLDALEQPLHVRLIRHIRHKLRHLRIWFSLSHSSLDFIPLVHALRRRNNDFYPRLCEDERLSTADASSGPGDDYSQTNS
jgi:hypothetical protein